MTESRDASASVKIAAVLLVPAALAAGWFLFPGDAPPELARQSDGGSRDDGSGDDPADHGRGDAAPRGQQIDSPRIARSVAHAGNYTYVELFENEDETFWIAAPQFEAQVGDRIVFVPAMEQRDFHSPTLGRTFDRLIFASVAQAVDASDDTAGLSPREAGNSRSPAELRDVPKLGPPLGGLAIATVFADRQKLQGRTVTVRGTITKVNLGIVGANWYHLRDGSGDYVSGDLTFTSQQELELGQVVTLKGKLAVDHALGGEHRFAIFVSDPEISDPPISESETEPVDAS